ncbi:unnamed protein product [Rotaria socialis]|uniref:Cytochrome P450 n=1 Tax=Rotaria socialis TaxID=392032 RepID=A0A818UCD1_9BILA|nr:unnamed protein product [Rotaria socialis]CAF4366476.1 unnamed protein product [Rotaria socialis]
MDKNQTTANNDKDLNKGAHIPNFPMARTQPLRPPPDYARFRKENPILKAKMWDDSLVWLVTRHGDVSKVLSDPRFSKVRTHPGFPETGPGGKAAARAGKPTFVDMDPPEHTRHRGMVEQDFTSAKAEEMRPAIQKIVDKLLDEMLKKTQPVDLLATFGLPVPTLVIYQMLGVPYEDHEFLDTCNAIRTNGSATSAESSQASKDLMDYLGRLVDKKMKNPTDDIISRLAIEQVKTGKLTHDELVAMSFLLLVAGNATTANTIVLGTLTLLQHPDQLAELRKDPSLIKSAVEEILRYLTGSQFATRRLALEDVEIGGITIKKGEGVWALNASANEDEDVFPNATRFDIHRQPNPQLAFGDGIHVCVAQDLARAEVQIAIGTLIRRCPNLQLAVPADELQYVTLAKRDFGVAALPVKW